VLGRLRLRGDDRIERAPHLLVKAAPADLHRPWSWAVVQLAREHDRAVIVSSSFDDPRATVVTRFAPVRLACLHHPARVAVPVFRKLDHESTTDVAGGSEAFLRLSMAASHPAI
jgi:hypothetical protein